MNGRLLLIAAFLTATLGIGSADAAVRTVCGIRQGSFGNASLDDRKRHVVLELARQGGDQHLVDQADSLVPARRGGEAGMRMGRRYCLKVLYGARMRPVRILAAARR